MCRSQLDSCLKQKQNRCSVESRDQVHENTETCGNERVEREPTKPAGKNTGNYEVVTVLNSTSGNARELARDLTKSTNKQTDALSERPISEQRAFGLVRTYQSSRWRRDVVSLWPEVVDEVFSRQKLYFIARNVSQLRVRQTRSDRNIIYRVKAGLNHTKDCAKIELPCEHRFQSQFIEMMSQWLNRGHIW